MLWSWKSPGRWWQGIVIQSSNFLCQLSLSFFWVSGGTQWCALWGSLWLLSPACLAYALLCYPSKLLAILIHVLLIPRPFDSARQSRDIPKSVLFLFNCYSNVKFATTDILKKVTWKNMFHQFMMEVSHSNVKFVNINLLERVIWKNMLHLFKKEISNSNLRSVTTVFFKRGTWIDMLHQFMKEISRSKF